LPGSNDLLDGTEPFQMFGDAPPHGLDVFGVAHHREALAQLQRRQDVGFAAVEVVLDSDRLEGTRAPFPFPDPSSCFHHLSDQFVPVGHFKSPCKFCDAGVPVR